MRGVNVLIMVDVDQFKQTPTGTPVWLAVGGQRNATLSESNETIDVTSKDSDGAAEYDYGLYSWSMSCDGVYVSDEEAYEALKKAMRQKKKIKVRITEDGTAVEEGEALVTSRELDAPYDAEVTYSVELQGTGPITPVV